MTTMEMIALLITPAAAVVIAGVLYWIARRAA